ncbi:MAG: hypothetical protein JW941_09330 [Candidatus Coatesbacteria bacterium]|nr:hypothetical protein [Candidatus Coatesbacteria bacterium]
MGGSRYEIARAVAGVGHRLFVSIDGELVEGSAAEGDRALLFRPFSHIDSRIKVAGGLPVKEAATVECDEEETRSLMLCLDGAECEPPYTGWLGRLLVLENGFIPRLSGIPHDPRFSGYRKAGGCHLIWAHGQCAAPAQCRNAYGSLPCKAPIGFTCDRSYSTCKDRINFAPCPHTFGESPCLADPQDEPCQHSVATCRAIGRGSIGAMGESLYVPFGGCDNTYDSCEARASFMPFTPEFHVHCELRSSIPLDFSLHAVQGRRFFWLGSSQEEVPRDVGSEEEHYVISRVYISESNSLILPRSSSAHKVPTVPRSALVEKMRSVSDATGIGVADISYSASASRGGTGSHHLASVQWITSSSGEESNPADIVINSSPDGVDWSDDGRVVLQDCIDISDAGVAGRPASVDRIEYRAPRPLQSLEGDISIYALKGHISFRNEPVGDTGHRRVYDKMSIRLSRDGEECTFDPTFIDGEYIPPWPGEPDGQVRVLPFFEDGTLISTFCFRFGASGWPTGTYEIVLEKGRYWAFIPLSMVVAHRDGNDGDEVICVPVLVRYTSWDGLVFSNGTIVKDRFGLFMTCAHSIPVCRSWSGAACLRDDGFCGANDGGRFVSLFPHCDGQGTGGAPGGQRWSRYEPCSHFRPLGGFSHARTQGPPYALAGCLQRGEFACKLKKAGYRGQWCARQDCPGFTPRGLWGSSGIKALNLRTDNIHT